MRRGNAAAEVHLMSNNLPSIAKLAAKHGIIPLKKLGQNFIFDETLCDKIVKFVQFYPLIHRQILYIICR